MFRVVVLFCAVLALAKGQTTQVNQCLFTNSGPLPINAYIHGCEVQPCGLVQGQIAKVEIIFRAPYTMHRMRTVPWVYLGIPFPYGLGELGETCDFLSNTYCPVVKDEVVKFELQMPIEDFMPVGIQLPIEFRVQDDNSRFILCLRVQVAILPPINKMLGAQNSTITTEV